MTELTTAPLSFAQEQFIAAHPEQPPSAENTSVAYSLYGELDVRALRTALEAIVARHAILRTTIASVDGGWRQIIAPAATLPLTIHDLTAGNSPAAQPHAAQILRSALTDPVDLAAGPLLRPILIRLAAQHHVLFIAASRVIFDAASWEPFNRELSLRYAGHAAELADLPAQYADVARAERAAQHGFARERDLAHWRDALAGAPPRIELATDMSPCAGHLPRPQIYRGTLPVELASRLAALGRSHGATLYASLLAAFTTLLFRYTEQTDLVVGRALDARPMGDGEALIGPFADLLALRMPVRGTSTFAELVKVARTAVLGAYEHRAAAFSCVAAAATAAGESALPLPNVLFSAGAQPLEPPHLPGLQVEPYPLDRHGNAAALDVRYAETADGIALTVHYDGQRFHAATIERLACNFIRLVRSVVDATDTPIGELPLLDEEERHLLGTWNPEPDAAAAGQTICARFEECVKRAPDAIAVADGTLRLTYGELNAKANALAEALRPFEICADDVIAIGADRSAWTIVAMIAILKAGGAYLPLDPAYPPEQLRAMVAAAEPRVILTGGTVGAAFAGAPNLVDLDALDLGTGLPFDPPADRDADALAYLMFTSGSTGRAKGVLVTHRAVVNLVHAPTLAIAANDVVAQMSNLSFDGATYEIWGALLNGARLEIIDRDTMLVPRALAAALRERRISVAFLTSALLRHVAAAEPAAFATLRCLIAGGEVVDPAAVRAIFAHGAPQRLLNGYGPSETTTFATTYEITEPPHGPIPIGRPLRNVEAFILDAHGNAVPIGVRGQLHIGGLGVARGYLNAPELTAQRFVPHPMRSDGGRVYATGDVARFLPDGNIEFFGRADRQVKLRGYRIELDDVEAALKALPGVADAVVTVRERGAGTQQLMAYVVDTDHPPRAAVRRRTELQAQLPAYMIPDLVVGVAAIPLTPNGKVDVGALEAAFEGRRVAESKPSAAPAVLAESAAQRAIARIFADVLGIARAAAGDDFFALGGHSLLAAQAIARIGNRFGVEVSLRDFFAEPTAAALARRIVDAPARPVLPVAAPSDARVAHMSDAQIDALLSAALGP